MARPKNLVAWTISGTLLSLVLPILGAVLGAWLFPEFQWRQLPLHALVEASGGLIALAIGGILLAELGHKSDRSHYACAASAFASMGVLDLFHAAANPGNEFVWFRSTATFAGGLFFALVWLAPRMPRTFRGADLPGAVAIMSVAVGTISVLASRSLPTMHASDGQFSTMAITLHMLGGLGYLVAAGFFARRFTSGGEIEDWLFGLQTALFGAAALLFTSSTLWDGAWWWWHLLRVAAYTASLLYGLRTFRAVERELLRANEQLSQTNAALDRTVEQRTARLRAIEERFELAVRGSTDGLWDWNVPTGEVYYSPRIKELIGYADDEFPNVFASFEAVLHPGDREWVMREVGEHLHHRKPYDVEYRLRTKKHGYRWFRARGQAIWDDAGKATRMAGSITDVTEEHRLRERFRLAVEASPAALLMVHRDGRIQLANHRSLTMFGYTEAQLIGQSIDSLVPPRFRAEHPAHRKRFFENPMPRTMGAELELIGVRQDGSEFPVKVGLSPVETAEGLAVICGVMDITDQRATLEAMRQAKEAAESASRAKSSFLANMSHEIRTPMNGIIGMSQLLARTELRSHQRNYLAAVEESARILLRLLNDILDFSKIEAGKLELESADFCISACVARASQMLALRAAEKGLEITCRIAPEIPAYLRGDAGRLQQVLVNLIGNAVKFTVAGEIFVNIDAESIDHGHVRLRFSISDTGIGIPPDKLHKIFHPFEQAETSTTRRFGGTGLGLTISRQLVEMMGGRMWVDSEPGRGSTFHFTAEFAVSADQHLHAPVELDSLFDLPVLVVDDNSTNRRILNEILRHWHMQPVLADSAAAARAALQAADEAQRPIRLILLDHHMPGEDGLQFAASVGTQLQRQPCPIILISSGSSEMEAELCQKHGIDRFLTKPVLASELLNEVLCLFGRYTIIKPEAEPTAVTAEQVQPRRVLLVEDNAINRRVALGLLRARGHEATVAENGQIAVDMLATQEFDVVLMDMQMPVMDGYEATIEIRNRERHTGGHIPIVAMTAEALKGDREHCLAVGMDDYVSKPIAPAEMYRAIERFPPLCLESRDGPPAALSPGAAPAELGDTPQVPASPKNAAADDRPPAIDWNVARERLGGGVEVLREFTELAKSETPTLVADLRRAIDNRDFKLLRRSAHSLKGSLTHFGAEPFVQAALALENLGRSESLENVTELLVVFDQELERVRQALEIGPPDSLAPALATLPAWGPSA